MITIKFFVKHDIVILQKKYNYTQYINLYIMYNLLLKNIIPSFQYISYNYQIYMNVKDILNCNKYYNSQYENIKLFKMITL